MTGLISTKIRGASSVAHQCNLKFNHGLVECPYQVNEITARKMLLFAFLTLHYFQGVFTLSAVTYP